MLLGTTVSIVATLGLLTWGALFASFAVFLDPRCTSVAGVGGSRWEWGPFVMGSQRITGTRGERRGRGCGCERTKGWGDVRANALLIFVTRRGTLILRLRRVNLGRGPFVHDFENEETGLLEHRLNCLLQVFPLRGLNYYFR